MTAVFWAIVLLGILWIAYSVGSDRRNPPMRRCNACEGSGIGWTEFGYERGNAPTCTFCDGEGWRER